MEQQNPWTAGAPATSRPTSPGLIIGLVLGGVLLLLVFVAAGGLFAYGLYQERTSPPTTQGNPDDIVLRQEPGTGPAMRYGDTPIYDACALVTIDALSRLGVSLSRDYLIRHEHLDTDVPPQTAITPGLSGSVSGCFYTLDSEDSLDIRVHQTPFNSADELTRMRDRATRAQATTRSDAGLTSATWHDKEYETQHLLIWRDGLVADISVRTGDADGTLAVDTFIPKLETLARSGLSSAPTAPVRHVYAAPFDKVKDPCQIVSVNAYKAAYPSHTGAPSMVDASYPLDAPIPNYQGVYSNARQAELSCTRSNIVPRGVLNKDERRSLQVDLSVWTQEKAADLTNDANCAPTYRPRDHRDPVAITPPIGTRKSCLADYESDWLLKFQASYVSVTVADGGVEPKPDVSVRRDQLVPAARLIASEGLFR